MNSLFFAGSLKEFSDGVSVKLLENVLCDVALQAEWNDLSRVGDSADTLLNQPFGLTLVRRN
jgi:hypothetical protein